MTLSFVAPAVDGSSSLRIGGVIAGRYRLERILGEGGGGVVWAARQMATNRAVAVKFLKDGDASSIARFLREARVNASLLHRNIVQVFDCGELEGEHPAYLVMELLDGETLGDRLRRDGALSPSEAVSILLDMCRALRVAHGRSVLHRDLKPDNIFLSRDADGACVVKVVDFGLAKSMVLAKDATAISQSGAVMGTPFYMAPEQVYGERTLDARADVWALGVIFYECLTSERPFQGHNIGQVFRRISEATYRPIRDLVPTVSPEIESIVAWMLRHEREERMPSLDALFEERFGLAASPRRLAAVHEVAPVMCRPERTPLAVAATAPSRSAGRAVAVVGVVAAALAMGIVVGVFFDVRALDVREAPIASDVGAQRGLEVVVPVAPAEVDASTAPSAAVPTVDPPAPSGTSLSKRSRIRPAVAPFVAPAPSTPPSPLTGPRF